MESTVRNLIEEIYSVIYETSTASNASLHEPDISDEDIIMVKKALETKYVSSVGSSIVEFEQKLCKLTGINHAIAMNNGTSSLHIALLANGINDSDEVLVPAMTFIASANAISYCNAIPHFVDSDIENLGIDTQKLLNYLKQNTIIRNNQCFNAKTGRRIFAIMPVHIYGFIGKIEKLKEIADEFKMFIIEDAAESLGSFKNRKHAGTFGHCGCISFNGNKIITTGGGGALITNNEKIANIARHLSTTAKINHPFDYFHDKIGYNYRMPALNAALGISQLNKLTKLLKRKKILRNSYIKNFKKVNGIEFFEGPSECNPNFWLNSVVLHKKFFPYQHFIIEKLNNKGFGCRPIWRLLNELPPYTNSPSMNLDNAKNLQKSFITIPSSAYLGSKNEIFEIR